MAKKFGQTLKEMTESPSSLLLILKWRAIYTHRGKSFVGRFDANTYLYITKAMDYFDALQGREARKIIKRFRYESPGDRF